MPGGIFKRIAVAKKRKAPEKKKAPAGVHEEKMDGMTGQGTYVHTVTKPVVAPKERNKFKSVDHAKKWVNGIEKLAGGSSRELGGYIDKVVENRGDFTPEQWKQIESLNEKIQGEHTRTMDEIINTKNELVKYKETPGLGPQEMREVEGAIGDILRTQDVVKTAQIRFNSHVAELGTAAQKIEPIEALPNRFKGAFSKAFGLKKKQEAEA